MAQGSGFLDDYLPYLLRRADQTLSSAFYEVLAESGVARSEWRVLAVLEELGPLSVLDLTNAALSPQPTVTHAVRRLEARGLVTRTAGATDRRQRIVAITVDGSTLTRRLIDEARRREATALEGLDELGELIGRLRRLIVSLEGVAA
ncbi:MAG: MarR family transcriptional regulator [Actinomycetota bacterium]